MHQFFIAKKQLVVPLAGLEPACFYKQQILSLPRLPVPPRGHIQLRGWQSGPEDPSRKGADNRDPVPFVNKEPGRILAIF